MALYDFHRYLAWFLVLSNAAVGVWALLAHVVPQYRRLAEIVHAAETLGAAAVGLSVSLFAPEEQTLAAVSAMRSALPAAIELWVGGAGAAKLGQMPEGVLATPTLDELDGALARLER